MFDLVPTSPAVTWPPPIRKSRRRSWPFSNSPTPERTSLRTLPDHTLSGNIGDGLSDAQNHGDSSALHEISAVTQEESLPDQFVSMPTRSKRMKPHKKSRRGCYNCKRRKIKCPENRPLCHNCNKINIICQYPTEKEVKEKVVYAGQDPTIRFEASSSLQSTPILFSSSDMQLFHHFLMYAYPHLPMGNESVWVRDIAAIAHSYPYLLHSLLALSASHLSLLTPATSPLSPTSSPPNSSLHLTALHHRGHSIRLLNTALTTPPTTSSTADAILATAYALTFQTSYLGSSIEEFLTLLRGYMLVFNQGWDRSLGTVFHILTKEEQVEFIVPRFKGVGLLDERDVRDARESLGNLKGLDMSEVEKEVYELLTKTVTLLSTSSLQAYLSSRTLSRYFTSLSPRAFNTFVAPSNTIAQILLAHFIGLHVLMAPLQAYERSGNAIWVWEGRGAGSRFSVGAIRERVPVSMRGLLGWCLRITGEGRCVGGC